MFACEMPIKSAGALWVIKVIPSSYALRTSTGPRGMVGWIAIRRPIIPSGWLISAKLCRSKEGGATGAAVFRVARCLWATATCGMKTSKHRATTINRNFIFTPQAVSHEARSCGVCLYVLRMPSLTVERQASGWVVDGTTQSAHPHPGETHTTGLVQAIKLGVLTGEP